MKKFQSHWTMKFRSNPASETCTEMQYSLQYGKTQEKNKL